MLKYCNEARTTIAFSEDGGVHVRVVDAGNPLFEELKKLDPEPYVPVAPPGPTIEDYRKAIDGHVEAVALERGYNSAAHFASYVASTVQAWAEESRVFIEWRDQVWVTAIKLMNELRSPIPVEEVIDHLPKVDWK